MELFTYDRKWQTQTSKVQSSVQLKGPECLTQRRDAIKLSLMNEHVHIDRAWVELFGPQEVEDGGEQRRIPVNEDL